MRLDFCKLYRKVQYYYNNPIIKTLLPILYFVIILLSFHYFYNWWADKNWYPFTSWVNHLFNFSSQILLAQSDWILTHVFALKHEVVNQTIWVNSNNGSLAYVEVSPGCTSLKQWLHFIIIIVLFPGYLKHKLWFIPAGVVVLHFVNIFRIVGLSLILKPWPSHFHFFHDYVFKTLFYAVIFLLWVMWVEFFQVNRKKSIIN